MTDMTDDWDDDIKRTFDEFLNPKKVKHQTDLPWIDTTEERIKPTVTEGQPAPQNPKWIEIPVLRPQNEIENLFDPITELGGLFCGGMVRWMCSPVPSAYPKDHPNRFRDLAEPGDIDIYCKDEESYQAIRKLLTTKNQTWEGTDLQNPPYKEHVENDLALTLWYNYSGDDPDEHMHPVQLIRPFEGALTTGGKLIDILEHFDFSVVRVGLLSLETAQADGDFVDDEMDLRLRIKHIHCPISSLIRVCKYARKGYYIRPSEVIKLFMDWDNRSDDYCERIVDLFQKSTFGEMTQEEIDHLEALLRVD